MRDYQGLTSLNNTWNGLSHLTCGSLFEYINCFTWIKSICNVCGIIRNIEDVSIALNNLIMQIIIVLPCLRCLVN